MTLRVAENIDRIRETIERSCQRSGRKSSSVVVYAVAKGVEPERIREAVETGIHEIGENRLQEAERKMVHLSGSPIRWHFIGRLQTNKVKKVIELFHSVQSLDAHKQALVIEKHLDRFGMVSYPVLLQVNLTGSQNQGGVAAEEVIPFLEKLQDIPPIRVTGLMTIAPFVGTESLVRGCFQRLRDLLEKVNRMRVTGDHPLRELSMGMSDDYALAVEEGATIVRLGRVLFGERSIL
ncbi:MAG TPA: YggS family pyridoxal phosphate-dependent enzyme [Atribacteraceae bacterium]|nr:YggS family pyridoxal phosphate-dependent enzyme [Atribacteraceae bacterium]